MNNLPNRINAIHTVTYNVEEVRDSLAELNGVMPSQVSETEIFELIQSWITEDFGQYVGDLTVQDENGDELDW